MKFDQTIDLSGASPERVWAFVMDVPSMAKCIPGCDGVEDLGNNHYKAVVKIKVGPIGLSLASDISIVEKDEANRTASLLVEAADKRVGGAVKATMSMKLTPEGDGTKLEVSTDANVMKNPMRKPESTTGHAPGTKMYRSACTRVAPCERADRRNSGSTPENPAIVFSTTGKNP